MKSEAKFEGRMTKQMHGNHRTDVGGSVASLLMNWPQLIPLVVILVIAATALGDGPATQPATDPLEFLESKTLYYPRAYEAADIDGFLRDGGIRLDYKTAHGKQTAC